MNNKNVVTKTENVTYYVNEEKKTVVAVIKCDIATPIYILDKLFMKFVKSNGKNNLLEMHSDNFNMNKAFINKHYVGIAKCHEGDTFDVEFGKKLALARAKSKKTDAIQKNFFKFVEQLDELNYVVDKKYDVLYRSHIDSTAEEYKLLKSITK